jgi:hypothetical protein
VLARLRAGIVPTDDEAEWDRYVSAVVRAVQPRTSPHARP